MLTPTLSSQPTVLSAFGALGNCACMNRDATIRPLPLRERCQYCGQPVTRRRLGQISDLAPGREQQKRSRLGGSLHRFLVKVARLQATGSGRDMKGEHLLAYVVSDEFRDRLRGLLHAADDLRNLQAEERKRHEALWGAQEEIINGIEQFTGRLRGRVQAILEGRE